MAADRGRAVRWAVWAPLLLGLLLAAQACTSDEEPSPFAAEAKAVLMERLGGETTVDRSGADAFQSPATNLSDAHRETFARGDALFRQEWLPAPAEDDARDGLGPLFNAPSCFACHGRDGRARPPDPDDPQPGMVARLAVAITSTEGVIGGVAPDPLYGDQIQDRAVLDVDAEGRVVVAYEEIRGEYADGAPYTLLKPTYALEDLAYGPLDGESQLTALVAPAIIGAGLLEAIREDDIRARVDPRDADGDGISGRAARVWHERIQGWVLGRFGWKANQPSVEQQVARALQADMGITSRWHAEESCTAAQEGCSAAPGGGVPEIPNEALDALVTYSQTLAVPAMRNAKDPQVRRGAELFFAAGCHLCHTPSYTTGNHDVEALSNQLIFPYTDLLLHDMGEGLADGRPVYAASGSEWRTPPLWGIGLVETVNGHTRFLHDGRARNLAEAILWHGGEGEAAKDAFREMTAKEREVLLAFLQSL